MTGSFADVHDELRRVARVLLAEPKGDDADWRAVADAGWLGLEVPEALGGSGVTFAETAVVLEELGRAAAPLPYLGTAVLGVGALAQAEASERRDELLAGAAAGELRLGVVHAASGEVAVSSPAFGVDGAGRLAGRAEFVVDAIGSDRLLLLAAHPVHGAVLVEVERGAVEVTPQPVLDRTRAFAVVAADGVPLAADAVMPLTGDPQQIAARAAVAIACDAVGLAGSMLDATVEYAGARRQFGRPIGSFQAVKHTCADMMVQLSVARELVSAAVDAVVHGTPDATAAVARAKSFATETAVDVVGAALQLHGGIGYTWESGIHVYLKRATLDRSLFGSPSAHRRRLAESVIVAASAAVHADLGSPTTR